MCYRLYTGNNIKKKKVFLIGLWVGPMQCAPSRAFSIETLWSNWSHNWHKLGPINGFSPRWWRCACSGLKLEWIPFHIFHIWNIFCQSFVSFELRVTQCIAMYWCKSFVCKKDEGRFWYKWLWKVFHMWKFHSEICGKVFTPASNLRKHIVTTMGRNHYFGPNLCWLWLQLSCASSSCFH